MSTKRGRPPLPPDQRRHVRVAIAVRTDVADALFACAKRRREPLSAILNSIFERIAERETALTAYRKSEIEPYLTR